ncbi:hypothetical protein OH77DRAFT_843316 [Trametes cingulata]|nr:hypothetical protein OH77DRAFT_843316 [Trametes cingulata]
MSSRRLLRLCENHDNDCSSVWRSAWTFTSYQLPRHSTLRPRVSRARGLPGQSITCKHMRPQRSSKHLRIEESRDQSSDLTLSLSVHTPSRSMDDNLPAYRASQASTSGRSRFA